MQQRIMIARHQFWGVHCRNVSSRKLSKFACHPGRSPCWAGALLGFARGRPRAPGNSRRLVLPWCNACTEAWMGALQNLTAGVTKPGCLPAVHDPRFSGLGTWGVGPPLTQKPPPCSPHCFPRETVSGYPVPLGPRARAHEPQGQGDCRRLHLVSKPCNLSAPGLQHCWQQLWPAAGKPR